MPKAHCNDTDTAINSSRGAVIGSGDLAELVVAFEWKELLAFGGPLPKNCL